MEWLTVVLLVIVYGLVGGYIFSNLYKAITTLD